MSGHDTIGRDAIGRGETVSGETRLRDAGHGAVPGPATAFDEAKFGLFVHWGAYSVGGIEASWPVMLGPELQRRFIDALHRVGMTEVEMPERPITLERYEAFPGDFQAEGFDAAQVVPASGGKGTQLKYRDERRSLDRLLNLLANTEMSEEVEEVPA